MTEAQVCGLRDLHVLQIEQIHPLFFSLGYTMLLLIIV